MRRFFDIVRYGLLNLMCAGSLVTASKALHDSSEPYNYVLVIWGFSMAFLAIWGTWSILEGIHDQLCKLNESRESQKTN